MKSTSTPRALCVRGLAFTPEGSDEGRRLLGVRVALCLQARQLDDALCEVDRALALASASVANPLPKAQVLRELELLD